MENTSCKKSFLNYSPKYDKQMKSKELLNIKFVETCKFNIFKSKTNVDQKACKAEIFLKTEINKDQQNHNFSKTENQELINNTLN